MLTDAESNVASSRLTGSGVFRAFDQRSRAACKVGVAADHGGDVLRNRIQHGAGCAAGGDFLLWREAWQIGIPAFGQFARLCILELGGKIGVFLSVCLEQLLPLFLLRDS